MKHPQFSAVYERIRAALEARPQSWPLVTALQMRQVLGGWPDVRTVQRYMRAIRKQARFVPITNDPAEGARHYTQMINSPSRRLRRRDV